MEGFADFWLRTVFELLGQTAEQSASDQSQISQEIGVARTGAILPHQHIPAPVVADFHACPMPANQLKPLRRRVLIRGSAGEVIAAFGAGGSGLFEGALAAQYNQGAGVRKVGRQRFDGPGVEGTLFDASVAGCGFDKKGVCCRRPKALARLKRLG